MARGDTAKSRLRKNLGPLLKAIAQGIAEALEAADLTEPDADAIQRSATIAREIEEEFEAHGLSDIISEAESQMIQAAADVAPLDAFSPSGQQGIQAVVDGHVESIARIFEDSATQMRRVIVEALTIGVDLDEAMAEVASSLDTTLGRAESAVFTAVQSVERAATLAQGEELLDDPVYLYAGPASLGGVNAAAPKSSTKALSDFSADRKVRPFCAKRVGFAWTMAALAAEDNGQGLPVQTTLGGYNCRHTLIPMERWEARQEGYKVKG